MKRRDGFLCYAHCGGESPSRKFVTELTRHLNGIQPGHGHRAWSDQDIRAGDDWPAEIRKALDQAAYAVLFVNIELLDSEFVRQVELPALLEAAQRDGLLLLALCVSRCPLPDWLARIQFSNHEATPLGAAKKTTRDLAYTAVAERVNEHLADSAGQSQALRLMGESLPVLAARTTGVLADAAADATPLPDTLLADALSQQIAKDLARARERYLSGARAAAIADLDALLALPAWSHLAVSLRGRLLRTAALYRMDFGDDQTAAETLAARAHAEDPGGDGQVLDAHLAFRRGDIQAALSLLDPPLSPQARHLRAAMLIEGGDAQAALAVLVVPIEATEGRNSDALAQADPKDAEGNTAETWRLRALACLLLKRLPDAIQAIEAAQALAPDWIAVRSAAAVVELWSACTPAALALTEQPLSPMPFARALVRADADARLGAIAEIFAEVAESMPADSHEQGHWLTWRLIALLVAGDQREEATTLAKQILEDGAAVHPWPLVWTRFFELDIDRGRLKERLAAVPPDDPNFILLRGLDIEMCLEDGEAEAVLDKLNELAPLAEAQGKPEVVVQWRVAALTAAGQLDEAGTVADTLSDERLRLRLRMLVARSRDRLEPGRYKDAAAALFAVDPSPDVLAEACDAHAAAADWGFVADHADALLAAIPTPRSLRLLAFSAFNTGDYRRCLAALDDHRDLYTDGTLPSDLSVLRVRCQRALGEPSQAVREARLLFEQTQMPEHLVELLNTQMEAADSTGMRESLERLTRLEPADATLLLQGARAAAPLDRELATRLWRHAVAQEIDDATLATQAAMLGERLGLDADQTGPWFQRMAQLAESGRGEVQKLHISAMPRFVREQHERSRQWLDKLWHGEIALHLLAGAWEPLPALLHADPAHNRRDPDPLLQRPTLIRHGARLLDLPKPNLKPRPRLILDLTALITAQSLGLLNSVEQAFKPLWLHRQWNLLLRAEAERMAQTQPRRSDIHAEMTQLVRCDAIALVNISAPQPPEADVTRLVGESVARELEWALASRGGYLTYLPLHGPDIEQWQEVDLPSPWQEVVIGPRGLLQGLLAEAMIEPEAYSRALADFPAEPPAAGGGVLPGKGAVLLSNPTLLGQFAELGLLTALSHRFRLQVRGEDWRDAEQKAENARRRLDLLRWTEDLIARVSTGMRDGRYQALPAARPVPDLNIPKHHGLDDLLAHPAEPGDRLWVEDRCINGFPSTGKMPIVGVVEVIDLLQAQGALKPHDRFEWLYRLRASGYRFIPLSATEVLHWLGRARFKSGRFLVPAELDTLAHYWAACLYQGDALQWNGNDRHGQGEIPFFVSSQSAVTKVLSAIWSDGSLSPSHRHQRADWVLDNLYVGVGDIPHLGPPASPERDMSLIGMDQAGLCFGAFGVLLERIGRGARGGKRDKASAKRVEGLALDAAADYLGWICKRIVVPRLLADPSSVGATAAAFRGLLVDSFAAENNDRLPRIGSWLLRFLPLLPPALREELHKDQDLMQRLRLEQVNYVEIGDLHFRGRDLWPAVESALRGFVPILRDIDRDQPYSLRLVSEDDAPTPLLELADAKGKPVGRHRLQFSELLLDARDRRLQALRAHPHWWDGEGGDCEAVEQRLSVIDSPALRIREIHRLNGQSADSHYLRLEEEWQRIKKNLPVDRCFPPSLSEVLTYIRCTGDCADAVSLGESCWAALVRSIPADRGINEPLSRFALLPCPLPDAAHHCLAALDTEARREVLRRATSLTTHPVGRLHSIDLLLAAAGTLPEALELAQEQIKYLETPHFEAELDLVLALVDLSYRAFGTEADEKGIAPRLQLLAAWAHAARLTVIMRRGGADLSRLAADLRRWVPFPHRDIYARGMEPMGDLAWAWNVEPTDLVFAGLGRVLRRHPDLIPRLDLSSLQARLERIQTDSPDVAEDLSLLRDPGLLNDTLGCLWGGDRGANLAPLIGPELASRYSPLAFAGLIDALLSDLATDPGRSNQWYTLWLTVHYGSLPVADGQRLDAILAGLDIEALVASDPLLLRPLMDLSVRHRSDHDAVDAQIYRWAEGIDSGDQPSPHFREQFGAEAQRMFGEFLTAWIHVLATRHPEDPDGEFARRLEGLIERSRILAAQLRGALTNGTRHLPYSRHRALRRTLLAAKARPSLRAAETVR